MREFELSSEEELQDLLDYLKDLIATKPIVLLHGELGAGKTTLVKHFVQKEEVSSPTFSLVNRYDTEQGPVFHFDLYRVIDVEELYDFGFEEYIDSGAPCFIEWPDIAKELIAPSDCLSIDIELIGEMRRYRIA